MTGYGPASTSLRCLMHQKDADLAVFPESMPFYQTGRRTITIDQACKQLSAYAPSWIALMAGGYVLQGHYLRNAVFLAYDGKIHGTYFKRIRWQDEPIQVGRTGVRFVWGQDLACIH
jgi:predicted amidohydrolase